MKVAPIVVFLVVYAFTRNIGKAALAAFVVGVLLSDDKPKPSGGGYTAKGGPQSPRPA